MRQLRLRMSDETVRSVMVDENQPVANLMVIICTKLGKLERPCVGPTKWPKKQN